MHYVSSKSKNSIYRENHTSSVSRYSDVVSSALRANGGDLHVIENEFKEIVGETKILLNRKRKVSHAVYYDRRGCYLCEAVGTLSEQDLFPRVGKVSVSDHIRSYHKEYEKSQCFNMHLKLSYSQNEDVIALLQAQPNKQGFIVDLLRRELKRRRSEAEDTV